VKLKQVKYAKNGKPYVEFKVMSGTRKGYITRRFGKISACPVCKEKFFARNEQLKRKKGKFCSVRCAKSFAKKVNRKEELASRRSKEIKNRRVYFGDDGKIYTEKKDARGKIYRYYGELKKCLACGEAFFADSSQIKLNKAKFCSRQCAKLKKKAQPEKENILPKKEEKKPDKIILIKEEETEEKVEEKTVTEEVKEITTPAVKEELPVEKTEAPAKKEELPVEKTETPAKKEEPVVKREFEEDYSQRYERRRRKIEEEEEYIELKDKPAGVLVFGIVLIYIAFYHLIVALRMSGAVEGQVANYLLTGMNLVLGFGILIMRPWARRLLYAYLIMLVGGAITAYLFTNFVDSTHKALVFSQDFTKGLFFAVIPYIFVLIYLINPSVKETFKKLKR